MDKDKEIKSLGDKDKRKKYLIKAIKWIAVTFAVLLLVLGAMSLFLKLNMPDKVDFTSKQDDIYYFPEDYGAVPEQDPYYMKKERRVRFTGTNDISDYIEAEEAENDTVRGLMYRYFEAVKAGDAVCHKALLADYYKEHIVVPDKFTPQMLYDIQVSFAMNETVSGVNHYYYRVSYKILDNNGSFRADVGSNEARAMVFDIVYDNGYKVYYIDYLKFQNQGGSDTEISEEIQ